MSYRSGASSKAKKKKAKEGGKKHGDAQKRKLKDFAGRRILLFLFGKGGKEDLQQLKGKGKAVYFHTYFGFLLLFFVFELFPPAGHM